jgi:hypothetical protein
MNMNAVSGIFVALSLIFGGGYALNKIYVATKTAAVERIQRGMPPLSRFTNQLTCSKISASGKLVPVKCKRSK